MKWGVRYRKADNAILGIYGVPDADLAKNFDPAAEGMIEIPEDHPIRGAQACWGVRDGQLVPQEPPAPPPTPAYVAAGLDKRTYVLLRLLNATRREAGLPLLTEGELLAEFATRFKEGQ